MKTIKLLLAIATLGLLSLTASAQSWLTNGLVAYYPFNGNANDASGLGSNGTNYGATATINRFGNPASAMAFGVENQSHIIAPETNLPHGTNDRTFTFWIRMRPLPDAYSGQDILKQGIMFYGQLPPFPAEKAVVISSWPNSFEFDGFYGAYSFDPTLYNLFSNTWKHVAIVLIGGRQCAVYLDGNQIVLPGSPPTNFVFNTQVGSYLMIGSVGYYGTEGFLNGALDDLRIYNRAFSATEIHQLYQYESPNCSPYRATATAVVVNGYVVGATITDGGCGYTNAPLVLIQGGGGSGATATAVISDGHVVGINITNPGSGYTNTVKIVIASPPFVPTVSIAFSRVNVTQHVVLGRNYLLESSSNLVDWVATGPQFTAQSEDIVNEFILNQTGQYFRIHQVP